MPLIALVARCAFEHQGTPLRAGQRFEASAVEAVLLVAAKRAAFAKIIPARAPVTPAPKKRTYKRRDLTADS